MLMTPTEMNNLLKQINSAFEALEDTIKDLEAKVDKKEAHRAKSGNSTKLANNA